MTGRTIRIWAVTTCAAVLLCAAPAHGAQAGSIVGSAAAGYTYAGAGIERNELRLSFVNNGVIFTELDTTDSISNTGGDCSGSNPVTCTAGTVHVAAGEGNDSFQMPENPPMTVSADGGPGEDTLVTGDGAQTIAGGAGDDYLDAGLGSDSYLGGAGNDLIAAADGVYDRIDCGDGLDAVSSDPGDALSGCEAVLRDADGDGSPALADCNDGNPAVRPGAPEVAGNGVDEDCNGFDLPPARITSGVRSAWQAFPSFTRNARLVVADPPTGSRVTLICRRSKRARSGCGFKRKSFRISKNRERLVLTGSLNNRRLRPRAVLEVRITAPRAVGKVLRYQIRRGRAPQVATLCLPPGKSKPQGC